MILLYDSLQLAHKCILNSFYGYVMRKGARWRSMEMAGVTTFLGGSIITGARMLVERVGRPLELDTDGIWCILPSSFPQTYKWLTRDGRSYPMAYPCVMLNYQVHQLHTNYQYQTEIDPVRHIFNTRSENSIFFELDGPYRAMVLPASTEEGRLLKKRYAVFNLDGSLAELKGFELKRRGELQIIKIFQSQVFERFLLGHDLESCYSEVAKVANYWLDVLFAQGEGLEDDELLELISESKAMSRQLEDYGQQKSVGITTAKRLAEFLGDDMVRSAGTSCTMIISRFPPGLPVTDRAIPTPIFNTDAKIRDYFLRKWSRDNSITDFDMRFFIDWDYYIDRFSTAIRKIITIPAGLQGIANPVDRVKEPDWLRRFMKVSRSLDGQKRISDLFHVSNLNPQKLIARKISSIPDTMEGVPEDIPEKVTEETHEMVEECRSSVSVQQSPNVQSLSPPLSKPRRSVKRSADFDLWLQQRKQQWRESRKQVCSTNIPSLSTKQNYYQILEIQNMDNSELVLWLITPTNQLQRIRVNSKHTLFINAKTKIDDKHLIPVNMDLPMDLPETGTTYLYSVEVNEHDVESTLSALRKAYDIDSIEGIYNSKMPTLYNAILTMGCVCRVVLPESYSITTTGIMKHVVNLGSSLLKQENVIRLLQPSYPYLTTNSARLGRLFLYIQVFDQNRGFFALFRVNENNQVIADEDPDKKNRCSFDVHVIEMNLNNEIAMDRVPYKKLLRQVFSQNASQVEVTTTTCIGLNSAYQTLDKYLNDFLSSSHPPTLLHLQSSFTTTEMRNSVPALQNLPIMRQDLNLMDSRVQDLTWRKDVALKAITAFYQSFDDFADRLRCARYAEIPVGNLTTDLGVQLNDVAFGRLLMANRHILWSSTESMPDLGNHDIKGILDDGLLNVSVNEAGIYRDYCFDIKLCNLCLNSIKQCDFLQENLNGDLVNVDDGCGKAFEILRLLVVRYMQDVTSSHDQIANFVLMNLERWLLNRESLLYNPLILRVVYRLMKLMFNTLLQEFRRLGLSIVFASYDHLVLSTRKYSENTSNDCIRFIVDTIQSKDAFRLLNFLNQATYGSLIWYNPNNFTGYRVWTDIMDDQDPADRQADIVTIWSLAQLLPEVLASYFDAFVLNFLQKPLLYREQLLKEIGNSGNHNEEVYSKSLEFVRRYVKGDLASELIRSISEFQTQSNTEIHEYPEEVLQCYKLTNPLLEMVKLICMVLKLDKALTQEATILRRQLLRNMRVKEFAPEAIFEDPFHSFVIPAVFCPYCNESRNMDICSDPDFQQSAKLHPWTCPSCGHEYDMLMIEMLLVEICTQKVVHYVQQDVKCQKCGQIKRDMLSRYCSCSGKWVNKEVDRQELMDQLSIVKAKAVFHGMKWLQETLERFGI